MHNSQFLREECSYVKSLPGLLLPFAIHTDFVHASPSVEADLVHWISFLAWFYRPV